MTTSRLQSLLYMTQKLCQDWIDLQITCLPTCDGSDAFSVKWDCLTLSCSNSMGVSPLKDIENMSFTQDLAVIHSPWPSQPQI